MNLVSKEFVASRKDRKGVLILSEMAGAASELGEALQINPTDKKELAEKIRMGLEMPEPEQEQRITLMQERIHNYNVYNWADDFFAQTRIVLLHQNSQQIKYLDQPLRDQIFKGFENAENRLFLLDYDGTLADFKNEPEKAIPSEHLLKLLGTLASDPQNDVSIISGRESDFLEKYFGKLNVNLVAEHGAKVKTKDQNWFTPLQKSNDWKVILFPILKNFVMRCPHSFIEEKEHGLAWHYRKSEADLGFIRSRELIATLHEVVNGNEVKVIDGNKVIEIKNVGIDKGTAALYLLSQKEYSFVLAIGDDKTDEDMFKVLQEKHHFTIKVGSAPSVAKHYLPDVSQVKNFLKYFI